MQRVYRHRRYLLVLATVLAFGLAGTASATKLLGGSDIADGSLTGADIKDGSIGQADMAATADASARKRKGAKRVMRGKRGKRGAQGLPGASGPAGPQGAQGPQGPPGSGIGIAYRAFTTSGAETVLFSGYGLVLRATCTSYRVQARPTIDNSFISVDRVSGAGTSFGVDPDFDLGEGAFAVLSGGNHNGRIVFAAPGQPILTVDYTSFSGVGSPQGDCVFIGTVTVG